MFGLWGCRGFTRQPKNENSNRAHFRVPAIQTPPKFNEIPPREGRKNEHCGGRGKKKRNCGRSGGGEGVGGGGSGGTPKSCTHENLEHTQQNTPHTTHNRTRSRTHLTQHTTEHTSTIWANWLMSNWPRSNWPKSSIFLRGGTGLTERRETCPTVIRPHAWKNTRPSGNVNTTVWLYAHRSTLEVLPSGWWLPSPEGGLLLDTAALPTDTNLLLKSRRHRQPRPPPSLGTA